MTLLLLVALLLSACQPIQAPPSAALAPNQGYTPLYEPADCKYDIPEGDHIECGYLTVPEDRSQPEGRMIRLYDDLMFVQFVTDSGIMGMDYLQTPSVIYAAYQGGLQPTASY